MTSILNPKYTFIYPRNNSLEDIETEAKTLVFKLGHVGRDKSLKPEEMEIKKDMIYDSLSSLANKIEKSHNRGDKLSSEARNIHFNITKTLLPEEKTLDLSIDPSCREYQDIYKMFVSSKGSIKSTQFLRKMSENLNKSSDGHRLLLSPEGDKKVVMESLKNFKRKRWLTESSLHTCTNCWSEVMYSTFVLAAKTFTVEMNTQLKTVAKKYGDDKIQVEDAEYMSKIVNHTVQKINKLLDYVEKKGNTLSKEDWVETLESLFRLVAKTINDIMFRYVHIRQQRLDFLTSV
jgi:hypothetical protein